MTKTGDRLKKHCRVFYGLDGIFVYVFVPVTTYEKNEKLSEASLQRPLSQIGNLTFLITD